MDALEFNATYNLISNITNELIGRKVVRIDDDRDEPEVGAIVAVSMRAGGRLWITWPSNDGEPVAMHARQVKVLKEDDLTKNLKWHGKTLGGLEKFIAQVRREGADSKTVLNPDGDMHVHIRVELPLATEPADPEVMHNHTFEQPCEKGCPRYDRDKLPEF